MIGGWRQWVGEADDVVDAYAKVLLHLAKLHSTTLANPTTKDRWGARMANENAYGF